MPETNEAKATLGQGASHAVGFWVMGSLVAILAAVGAFRIIDDPDLFWHLKVGEWILDHRAIPLVDEFSFTFAGRPFTTDWASELLMAALYRGAGEAGLFLLAAVLSAITMLLVAMRMRVGNAPPCASLAAVLLLLVYDVCSFRLTPRPQTFLFVCLGALLWLLESAEERRSLRRLAWLPFLIVLWGNLHISSYLALAFVAAFAVGHALALRGRWRVEVLPHWRWLSLLAVSSLLACLAGPNPLGRLHTAIGTLFTRGYTTGVLSEWQAPSLAVWFGPAGVLLAAAALSMVLAWRPWRMHEILAGAVAAWLGFRHVRFLPILALVLGPLVYRHLAAALFARFGTIVQSRRRTALAIFDKCLAGAVVTAFALGSLGFDSHSRWLGGTGRPDARLAGISYPVGAAQFLAVERPQGALFNTFHFGGYLIHRLGPDVKVFIDGRTGNLYDDAHVRDMMEIRHRWRDVFARWNIQYVITQPNELEDALAAAREWSLVYFDDAAFVYVRNDGINAALADRLGYRVLRPPFVSLPQGEDAVHPALQEAERSVKTSPTSALAHILRGRIRGVLRDIDGFEADMRQARDIDPRRPEPWQRLGLVALGRGQNAEAIRSLGRALELSPNDESIRFALAAAYAAAGDQDATRSTLKPLVRAGHTLEELLARVRQPSRL